MQLVVDVGNTETVVGLASSKTELVAHWRVSSSVPRTGDEMTALIRAFLVGDGHADTRIARGVIGSVVPSVNHVWARTLEKLVHGEVITVGPTSALPIELAVEEPLSVGADRIVNTLAAREMYSRDTIAVDLGTATTYDCITAAGVFEGGVIAPGISAGMEWLAARTAKLPKVELGPPSVVIGKRTETCIQAGVFYSATEGVDGIVGLIKEEWGKPDAYVVATGGFASSMGPYLKTIDTIEPYLTLYGLAMAGEILGG